MNRFGCYFANRVEFGAGKISVLPEWVRGKTILLLSDRGVRESGVLDGIAAALAESAAEVIEFFDSPTEPSEDDAAGIVARFRARRVDAVVAVGGGSVLDMAKVLAALMGCDVTVDNLFEGKLPETRSTALYMVPTTAGTGAEATPNSILYRPSLKLKVGVVCGLFVADRIILDPELTLGLPPAVTASTGLDALCHAVECLVSNKANPLSDVLAVEASRLIFANLRKAHADGGDIEARANMLLASFYAGVCIACAGTNIVHALSYPLGGRYRIAHGVSNAVLLAPAMVFNRHVAAARLARLAPFVPGFREGLDAAGAAELVIGELAALSRDMGIPDSLAALGVARDDVDALVEDAFKVRRLLDNNPREVGKGDIREIYVSLF